MSRWEYRVYDFNSSENGGSGATDSSVEQETRELDKLGEDGYELVAIRVYAAKGRNGESWDRLRAYLKRQKSD